MSDFADENGAIDGLAKAWLQRTFTKASVACEAAGTIQSLWKVAGMPGAGANPPLFSAGAGYVPTNLTVGAYPYTNATAPATNRIGKFAVGQTVAGAFIVYDRLWACSGFGTVVTTAQTIITPGSLPTARDPLNGLDVEPWLEIYTAPGATAATWTLTGTDGLGNTGRTWTYAHPANAETVGQQMVMMPGGGSPAATSTIRQPTSLTCSVSSGTAGDVGLTLVRRLGLCGGLIANSSDVQDLFRTGLPLVYNDACLALSVMCSTTLTGLVMGELVIANN